MQFERVAPGTFKAVLTIHKINAVDRPVRRNLSLLDFEASLEAVALEGA